MKIHKREKMNRRKGVLTVEAAIVLPIFVMVMAFVLNIMQLFYFHLVMQQSLQNVALTLAQYGYVVERTIGLENLALQTETKNKEQEIITGVNAVIDEGRTMISLLSNFTIDNLPTIMDSGGKFKDKAESLVNTIKGVDKETIVNYLLVSAMNEVGGDFVKWMIGDYLSEMGADTGAIDSLEYQLIIETETKDMLLIVEYDYKVNFIFTDTLRFQQMVRVHPWVGGNTPGLYKSLLEGGE